MFVDGNRRFAVRMAIGAGILLTACVSTARAQLPLEQAVDQAGQDQGFQQPGQQGFPAPSDPTDPSQGYAGAGAFPPYGQPDEQTQESDGSYGATLIPPSVEGEPYAAEAGGYCYVGPHPVDTRVMPGPSWDDTPGQHLRPYPPIDTRLFALRDGCYYFTGDPRDFGYGGQSYSYYGAHPILDIYGGGWCFMMGGHSHLWAPWSPYFTVVGSWNYWYGPYDPYFWAFWPYYSFYYRSYYPNYYRGGRFYRNGGYRTAPPIHSVPASAYRGAAPVRGTPPAQMYRSSPLTAPARGTPPAQMYRGSPPTAPAARPPFAPSPAPRPVLPSRVGGFGSHGGGFHGGGGRR